MEEKPNKPLNQLDKNIFGLDFFAAKNERTLSLLPYDYDAY